MRLGINAKLSAVFLGLLVLMGATILFTFVTLDSQKNDGIVINLAGRQRMLTQKMSKESLAVMMGDNAVRKSLATTVEMFDKTHKALINGGKAPLGGDNFVDLPPTQDPGILGQMREVDSLWKEFHRNVKVILDRNAPPEALKGAINFIKANNVPLLKAMNKAVGMYESVSTKGITRLKTMQIIFLVIAVVAALGGSLFLSGIIVKPLVKGMELAEAIAAGDLTKTIDVKSNDEIGKLSAALNKMAESLNGVVSRISDAANHIASASEEISASTEQMAKGAEDQTKQTDQVATAVEEMSATVLEVAKNSNEASGSARKASDVAKTGGEVVQQTIEGMNRISASVMESARTIEALGKSSDEIGEIIAVIDDIADQTNLLALNAAIEAARAGEQGRGFAVVADEVRKLAERTTKATKEIAAMIKTIQADTKGAVQSMTAGTEEVESGVELANEAGRALDQIVEVVGNVTDMIQQIATAAEEQSAAAEEISTNVEAVATITKETAAGAKQSSIATQELTQLAVDLQKMVGQFKLR